MRMLALKTTTKKGTTTNIQASWGTFQNCYVYDIHCHTAYGKFAVR